VKTIRADRISFVLAPLLLISAFVSPQQARAQDLGTQMAEALQKAKVHSVLVFDFIGPNNQLNGLGQDLAEKFSTTLQKSSSKLTVVDRADVKKLIETNRVAPDVVRNIEIAWWLARQLKVDTFVLGNLSIDGDKLEIQIGSVATKDGKSVGGFTASTPISEGMKARLVPVAKVSAIGSREVMAAKGTIPACVHCPNPTFSDAAVNKHIAGTVLLSVLIGLDGRAHQIEILKPVDYRLTEKAIEAVQAWTFSPGKSADEKPIEVLTPIEVTFKYYK
jgi:TonB family protein